VVVVVVVVVVPEISFFSLERKIGKRKPWRRKGAFTSNIHSYESGTAAKHPNLKIKYCTEDAYLA